MTFADVINDIFERFCFPPFKEKRGKERKDNSSRKDMSEKDKKEEAPAAAAAAGEEWNVTGLMTMGVNVCSSVAIALCLKALFLSNGTIPMSGLVVFHMLCSMVLTNVLYFFGFFDIPPINWPFLIAFSTLQVCVREKLRERVCV